MMRTRSELNRNREFSVMGIEWPRLASAARGDGFKWVLRSCWNGVWLQGPLLVAAIMRGETMLRHTEAHFHAGLPDKQDRWR